MDIQPFAAEASALQLLIEMTADRGQILVRKRMDLPPDVFRMIHP